MKAEGLTTSDGVAIITAVLTLIAVGLALIAIDYAKESASASKEAVAPLDKIATKITEAAALQRQSLTLAHQFQRIEVLSRRVSLLQQVVDAVAQIGSLASDAGVDMTGDPLAVENSLDALFNTQRRRLLLAIKMFAPDHLVNCRALLNAPGYVEALDFVDPAQAEAEQELNAVRNELDEAINSPDLMPDVGGSDDPS